MMTLSEPMFVLLYFRSVLIVYGSAFCYTRLVAVVVPSSVTFLGEVSYNMDAIIEFLIYLIFFPVLHGCIVSVL